VAEERAHPKNGGKLGLTGGDERNRANTGGQNIGRKIVR